MEGMNDISIKIQLCAIRRKDVMTVVGSVKNDETRTPKRTLLATFTIPMAPPATITGAAEDIRT